ncbi:hypothetical protein, partial [Coleofasciculus sp. E1-EBD-02]|uniref:hypothetical protein n=1 Tax=Coleofasciculus sp. E1-EBD-02 TaxID=3068481 RepID=UPI0033044142
SDGTVVPSDIKYPNDLGLLNQARVASEEIIDDLYESVKGKANKKPKTPVEFVSFFVSFHNQVFFSL